MLMRHVQARARLPAIFAHSFQVDDFQHISSNTTRTFLASIGFTLVRASQGVLSQKVERLKQLSKSCAKSQAGQALYVSRAVYSVCTWKNSAHNATSTSVKRAWIEVTLVEGDT